MDTVVPHLGLGYTPISGESATGSVRVALLRRLRRQLALRYRAVQFLDEQDVRLLDRSIYATYCDCLDLEMGDEARRLLDEVRAGLVAGSVGSAV